MKITLRRSRISTTPCALAMQAAMVIGACLCANLFANSASAQDCAATAKSPWSWGAADHPRVQLVISASTVGDDCHSAKATLAIHATDGRLLFAISRPTAQVPTLAGVSNTAQMTKALQSWVDATTCPVGGSDVLPQWRRGQPAVDASGNTPFIATLPREAYLRHRTAAEPLLCFVQDSDSITALAIGPNGPSVTRIGNFATAH